MAVDLTGILSINEYYTQHYLNTILEQDIKDTIKNIKEKCEQGDTKTPWSVLKELSQDFYKINDRLSREKNLDNRYELQHEFLMRLFEILGYEINNSKELLPIKDDELIPVFKEIKKQNGSPELWILESLETINEDIELLHNSFSGEQFNGSEISSDIKDLNFEDLISKFIFSVEEPPRWIVLASYKEIILIDRSKWAEKRVINFKLDEIFARKDDGTLQVLTALLYRENICPSEGECLLDTLNENSHKNAREISEDLKYALRECIELLGNEAIRDMKERQRAGVFNRDLAPKLTIECLRYMYRILFLLYIESRPELGYAPMKSSEYLKGYSIESIREIADKAKADTDDVRNGTYIDSTLKKLFALIYEGLEIKDIKSNSGEFIQRAFTMQPLKAHIFDPERTEILNKVKFRNEVLLKVIKLMSISRSKGKERPARISYAQLGINQLGAVYEALLSYRGFLAEEDLYEVKKAGDKINELEVGYFVKESQLNDYNDDERVRNADGSLKKYPKGTFIYRLAGREREKSASYYTPEVLTKCLVKYALKELLVDKTADEILELTICEPAMGSAAFLNEAVNQLAEKYLELKQKEIGENIPHDKYAQEKQKVKMYIADRNVYGVDLNPVAVELAEVSLWLNTIYDGAFVPWFGLQLVNGNSLVGARKQVYQKKLLKNKKPADMWYSEAPKRIEPGEKRTINEIYHFLLGDPGMCDYNDKVIKELAKENIEYIKNWKKDFLKPYTDDEIRQLLKLSDTIDRLWEEHTKLRKGLKNKTTDKLSVYGHDDSKEDIPLTTREKDKILEQDYKSEGKMNAGPYARIKAAMDYWCSLWHWPIEKAELLPSRAEYLLHLSLILEGDIIVPKGNEDQMGMSFIEENTPKQQMLNTFENELGQVDLKILRERIEILDVANNVALKFKYLHWELEFADIFVDRKGFDLVLGNPPWLKLEFKEQAILSDVDPKIIIKKISASETNILRLELLKDNKSLMLYLEEFEEYIGTQNFIRGICNYDILKGSLPNLYKCFLPQTWNITNKKSIFAFIHPDGIYDDPKGGELRKEIYKRLRFHFQFINEKMLFDIDHHVKYSINICANKKSNNFINISNLFDPITIDECFNSNNQKIVEGIKDKNGKWNLKGHRDRVINVGLKELQLFAKLYDINGTNAEEARLPSIHCVQVLSALKCFDGDYCRLSDLDDIHFTHCWNETGAQKGGIIKRETKFVNENSEFIYCGPNLGVANPMYKTPRKKCSKNSDYDVVDLEIINEKYFPRTNYVPNLELNRYFELMKIKEWNNNPADYYRLASRKMLNISGERTLMSAIIPKRVAHIHGIFGIVIENIKKLLITAALYASIPYDFYIKTTGKDNLDESICSRLPLLNGAMSKKLIIRILLLNCINESYKELWNESWERDFILDSWAKKDSRLDKNFKELKSEWTINIPIRSQYQRRQALVEIDVIAAMMLGMSLNELKTIYRIQFPVLNSYEADTWYDRNGRIIFTNNRGLIGVGVDRKRWDEIKEMKEGTVEKTYIDDTMPGGPLERTIVYEAPFDRCDREKDYEEVWKNFEERFKYK